MKATLPKEYISNARNYSREKETIDTYNVIGIYKGVPVNVVTCRAYMGRSRNASTVYASIWVNTGPILSDDKRVYFASSCAGSGQASGYGYCKLSSAIGAAIRSAGIELWGDQYADKDGMTYAEFPNPEYSEEASDAAHAESYDAGRSYAWRVPKYIRKKVKENTKKKARIDGVGTGAVECALLAIGRAVLGARARLIIEHN